MNFAFKLIVRCVILFFSFLFSFFYFFFVLLSLMWKFDWLHSDITWLYIVAKHKTRGPAIRFKEKTN